MLAFARPLLRPTLIGIAALLAAGPLVLGGAPAWAHAELVSSNPADGATLDAAPHSVELVFTETVDAKFTQVAVLGADQAHVERGSAQVAGARVEQPIADLTAGDYSVSYRVVSTDGHPVSGVLKFSVTSTTQETAAATPVATPVPSEPDPAATSVAASSTTPGSADSSLPLVIGALAALALAGVIAFVVMGRRRSAPGSADGQE